MGIIFKSPIFPGKHTEWALWWTNPDDPNSVILRRINGEISTAKMWETIKFDDGKYPVASLRVALKK